jgi:hypothetical protein
MLVTRISRRAAALLAVAGAALPSTAHAQAPTPLLVTPLAEKKISEAFFVVSGEQSIRGPHGVQRVQSGQPEAGHGADMPMQVSSSGSTDLLALVMFVVDATKPFSSPAALP